jgi:phosphatidylglycerol:prolipoprotein diacylglycerol transferase
MVTQFLSFVWNPSEGFEIGSFTVRFYSLMFVIAFGLGWYIMKYIFIRENESLEKLDSLFIYTVIATLIGARLGTCDFLSARIIQRRSIKHFSTYSDKTFF